MARILIVGNQPEAMLNFRGDLIAYLISLGHEVHTAMPPPDLTTETALQRLGAVTHNLPMDRIGVNIFDEIRLLGRLRRLFLKTQPDAILAYTIKPVIYSALTTRLAGRPHLVAMITGLGYVFTEPKTPNEAVIHAVARSLYRLAMRATDVVIFQNDQDKEDFRRNRLIDEKVRVVQTNGSGVNLQRFARSPVPPGPLRFLMVSRLLIDKGVREYIAAAAIVRHTHPDTEFHLVGSFDENPASVTREEILAAVNRGDIVYYGHSSDVRPFLAGAHVFVLPSYREGMPRSTLEALATGRPIITTSAPGCRDTVIEGVNGFTVEARQIAPLAAALEKLVLMPADHLQLMGDASHRLAVEKFDVADVNRTIARALTGIASPRHPGNAKRQRR